MRSRKVQSVSVMLLSDKKASCWAVSCRLIGGRVDMGRLLSASCLSTRSETAPMSVNDGEFRRNSAFSFGSVGNLDPSTGFSSASRLKMLTLSIVRSEEHTSELQ